MELRSVSFAYDNESKKALNNISLKIYEGERVVILGHNGSGKSTLAKIMGALQEPLQGVCFVRGQNINEVKELRSLIGMVFQNPENQIVASIMEDDIAFAPENQGLDWQIIGERVENAIKITGLENKRGALTSEMSGGEKQRMALAGAAAAQVKCLILDEPTAMLDPEGRVQVEKVIKDLHKSGVTIVQITHQLEFFDANNNIDVDRILVLSHGELIWEGTPEKFSPLAADMGFEKFEKPISLEELKKILKNKGDVCDSGKNFIEIKNLYFRFASAERNILENINLDIKRGRWLSITGRTGSGKSTLVQHLNALYKIQAGEILIDGKDLPQDGDGLKDLRRRVGLVFQNPEDQLFCPTVREELEFAPRNFNNLNLNQAVLNAIKLVGLDESFLERSPLALSGGEKRLVAIASVLSAQPECIILDEPLAGLDAYYKNKILNMLNDLKNQGRNIVVITHDINSALKFSDEIIILERGKNLNLNINLNNNNSELAALSGLSSFNILGQYIPSGSIIHRLDPRAKLIAILFLVSAVISSQNFAQLALCLAGLLGLIKLAKISIKNIISSSRPIFFLAAFTFIFNLIALALSNNITFGQAFLQGAFLAARLLMLMFYAVLLPLTTTPLELSDGIGELLKPLAKFKFPAQECAVMIGMALRFIPLLMQETDKITRAQLSRGAKLDQGGIFKRLKAFFPVLIPLFIIIFRRADDMALAMEARGYNIGRKRTRRKPLRWEIKDTLAVILSLITAIIFFIIL